MAMKQSLVIAALLAVALTFCASYADAGSRSSSRSVSSSNKFSSTSTSSYKSIYSAPKQTYVAPPAPKPVYVAPKPAYVAPPVTVKAVSTQKPVVAYKPIATSVPATKVIYATSRPTSKPNHSAEIAGDAIEAVGTIVGAAIIANAIDNSEVQKNNSTSAPVVKPKPNFSFITDCNEWVCK